MLGSTLRLAGAVALVASLLAITSATTFAEEQTCRGAMGATTVDNLRVPDDATCTLNGTTVKGTIKVETDAVLKAYGVRVVGNVQGEDSRSIVVASSSRVGGSVQVVQSGRTKVLDSRISGDILVDDNDLLQSIRQSIVGGSIQAFQNSGAVRIFGNRVDGNKEDQCRGF
jgi:hypothetical protein